MERNKTKVNKKQLYHLNTDEMNVAVLHLGDTKDLLNKGKNEWMDG